MQAPQNFASAHHTPAGGAGFSTRAAVNGIFKSTDALLAGFHAELNATARARQETARSYMNDLRRSVQAMMAELRQAREDARDGMRASLADYMADLHAKVAEAMSEAESALKDTSRARQRAAQEFEQERAAEHDTLSGNERRHLEELASRRRRNARSLHAGLGSFAADLHSDVAQTRSMLRQELGFAERAEVKAKPRRKQAKRTQNEDVRKKSAPSKGKDRSFAMATETAPGKVKRQAKAKKTVKTAASAPSGKRRVH